MGSPRVGSNPAVVALVHLWPSGLRRYVQVVVIIRWRRFESCRVHVFGSGYGSLCVETMVFRRE